MKAKTDEFGFFTGLVLTEEEGRPFPPPSEPLPEGFNYRFVDGVWIIASDLRGTVWYDPDNTNDIFTPTTFDEQPPALFVMSQEVGTPQTEAEKIGRAQGRVFDKTTRTLESAARQQRNALLLASDWTQLPDVPLATKEAWATYRQALRDITEQEGYPLNINWPLTPG